MYRLMAFSSGLLISRLYVSPMNFRMAYIVLPLRSFNDVKALCVISAAVGPFGGGFDVPALAVAI